MSVKAVVHPQNRSCRFVADNAMECIWTYDVWSGKFTFISPAVFKLTGFTVNEAMRLALADLLPKDSLDKANAIIEMLLDRYMNGERQSDVLTHCSDFDLLCKNGNMKQVEITAKLIHNDETGFLEMLGIVWDVTNRKQYEERLNQTLENKDEMILHLQDSEKALKGFIEELHQKNKLLETRATRDSLTDSYNRYYFDQKVTEEAERCRRFHYPLSIVLFDIDSFKGINDTYGHHVGDKILIGVTNAVRRNIRIYDTFARWGGDEFILLMPQTALPQAESVAEKLRNSIQALQFENLNTAVTASFGVVEYLYGESEDSWFRRVDHAMFRSKSKGRNCVTAIKWEASLPFVKIILDWKSEWDSGNPVIDEQHRELVAVGNRLLCYSLENINSRETAQALEEMIAYIRMHSDAEVQILQESGYPDVKEHAHIHEALFRQMEELRKQHREGSLTFSNIIAFILSDLVMKHQLTEDVRYFSYLEAHGYTEPQKA